MSEPKITKQDILEKTPGMLQKQLYIVHTKPTNGLGPVMENIGPHLEFQVKIEQDGVMFAAGPGKVRGWWLFEPKILPMLGKLPHLTPCIPAAPAASRCVPGWSTKAGSTFASRSPTANARWSKAPCCSSFTASTSRTARSEIG